MVASAPFDPDTALALVALRTGGAALIVLRLRRDGEEVWSLALQTAADLAAALFVLGATRAGVRHAVGLWWILLFVYAAGWELRRLVVHLDDVTEPLAGEPPAGVAGDPIAAWAGGSLFLVWQALAVAPPVAAGMMLAFNAFCECWVFPVT